MAKYTLHYFDARARGESIRMIFAAGGLDYEDKRLDFQKDWPAFKLKSPTGAMPVLEVEGQLLTESMAIARFVARETGLVGQTSLQQAFVDSMADLLNDVRENVWPVHFCKEEDKKAPLKTALAEKATKNFGVVEKKLQTNQGGEGYLVGDSLTWADVHFLAVVEATRVVLSDVLKPFPGLQGLEKRVAALPRIATYLENRPAATM